MFRLSSKIVLLITLTTVIVSFIIGFVIINRSFEIVEQESKDKLTEMASRIGTEFDFDIREVESVREQVIELVESTMDLEALYTNPTYMNSFKKSLAPVIKRMAEDADGSRSVYVFFDPELTGKPHDVWFADLNSTGKVTRQEEFPMAFYEDESPEKDWYFKAKNTGRPFWTDPYMGNVYFDNHLIYVSNTAPIYIDGKFVGVAGADYYFDALKSRISDIRVYDTGYAILFNENMEALIHPTLEQGVSIRDIDGGNYSWIADAIDNGETIVEYTWIDGNEKILASKKLLNGWNIAVAPMKDQVYRAVEQMRRLMYLIILIGGITTALIGLFIGRRLVSPIEQIILDINKVGLGDYDKPIEHKFKVRNDEVGILANAVERMRITQKISFDEISEQNLVLEKKVDKRTEELSEINTDLENSMEQLEKEQAKLILTNQALEDALDTTQKTQKQLIESEKIASLGYLVGGIAHEINTPVGNSLTLVTYMQRESETISQKLEMNTIKKRDLHEYIESTISASNTIYRNLKTTGDLVSRFKQLAADESKENIIHFYIVEYMQLILKSMGLPDAYDNVKVTIHCDPHLEVFSDAGKFSQIFTNLVANSLQHGFVNGREGQIHIRFEKVEEELFVHYEDDGVGIEKQHLESIYTPFFTTKFSGETKGLGLNIVYNVVTKLFKGSIKCESSVDQGTSFFIKMKLGSIK